MQGDRTDKRDTSAFNTWKDIIIPGNIDDAMTTHGSRIVEPLPLSKRKHLGNYLGRAQGKVGRLRLIELSKQYPDKVSFFFFTSWSNNGFSRKKCFDSKSSIGFIMLPCVMSCLSSSSFSHLP